MIHLKQIYVGQICRCLLGAVLFAAIACRSEVNPQRSKIGEYNMVLIPGGEFQMGTNDSNSNPNRRPEHGVHLDAYYIGKHEVTNSEYEAFLLDKGYQKQAIWSPEGWDYIQKHKILAPVLWNLDGFGNPDQPVVGVSYYEAEAYAHWLSMRLPTEAEWQKAAQGAEKRDFPWGNTISFRMPYHALSRPFAIGQFPKLASPYGVEEMAGNVWEWVQDWHDAAHYGGSSKGPKTGSERILKGGSWASNSLQMKCNYRYPQPPWWRGLDVGFRLAADAE